MNHKKRNKTPKTIIIETVLAGGIAGIARVQWEKMNAGIPLNGISPSYFNYAFMAGFVALSFILAFELNYASWTKRVGMSLLAGFFFRSLISSGQLEAQLIQQEQKTQGYIEEVAQVSIESNSPASHSRAITALEDIALDGSLSEENQETAIEGLADVTEASNNYDVKMKAVASLVKIGIKTQSVDEKREIIKKLKEMDYATPSPLYSAVAEGIELIEGTIDP